MLTVSKIKDFLLGQKSNDNLPEFVLRSIHKQQLESEILVSWVLLALVSVISVLYFIAPSVGPIDFLDTIVDGTILAYLIIASVRLILAYLDSLPDWFLLTTAIFDVVILTVLVWSFHISFNQPPEFYLKMPAMQYVYILLGLRALRFEARYVLAVGISGVICEIFLLVYAIVNSQEAILTKNYLRGLLGEKIFLPTEINKILILFMLTIILTISVARGRRLLIRAISETRATKELSRFFEPEVASSIIASDEGVERGIGKQRNAAILHCDIRGFTARARRTSAKDLIKILTEYQDMIVKIALKHSGNIDKFLGDGVLISFNAVTENPNYAKDSLAAASEMLKANHDWQKKLIAEGEETVQIGITIASGDVTVGIVGGISRLEYTVIGDPVNLSAKLDKHCKVLNCNFLTTIETYELAVKQGFKTSAKVEIAKQESVDGVKDKLDLVVIRQ